MNVAQLLSQLVEDLDRVGEVHDEICDTEVREGIALSIQFYYVMLGRTERAPVTYGMFSNAGNEAVAEVVHRFISGMIACAADGAPEARLARFDWAVTSKNGSDLGLFVNPMEVSEHRPAASCFAPREFPIAMWSPAR